MRREKGTGGITQRKDGLWMATYNVKERGKNVRKYLYGKTQEETEIKLSIALSKQKERIYDTPGMRDNRERQALKKEIASDNGGELNCAICGWNGFGWIGMVEAHHIIPFKDGGEAVDENIIMLCPNHHRMVHKLGRFVDMGDSKESMAVAILKYEHNYKPLKEARREAMELIGKALRRVI